MSMTPEMKNKLKLHSKHHTAKHNKFATEIIKIYNPDLNLIDLK